MAADVEQAGLRRRVDRRCRSQPAPAGGREQSAAALSRERGEVNAAAKSKAPARAPQDASRPRAVRRRFRISLRAKTSPHAFAPFTGTRAESLECSRLASKTTIVANVTTGQPPPPTCAPRSSRAVPAMSHEVRRRCQVRDAPPAMLRPYFCCLVGHATGFWPFRPLRRLTRRSDHQPKPGLWRGLQRGDSTMQAASKSR